jgi:hypothetical protein
LGTIRIGRRKQMKTKNGIIFKTCALLAGALILFSCDNPVALGKRLNLEPPVVTIVSPDFMANISGDFAITGTAKDLEEVVFLTVTFERVTKGEAEAAWSQVWSGERRVWRSQIGDSSPELRPETETVYWVGGMGDIEWSVDISLDSLPKGPDGRPQGGEYLITVGAENNVKTLGAQVQRRVIIDVDPPVVMLTTPDRLQNKSFADATEYFDDPANGYRLRNPQVLDWLHNKAIKVQYKVEDEFSLETLRFQLVDSEGNVYYDKPVEPDPETGRLSWSDSVYIQAAEIIHPVSGAALEDKAYLKIISIASDRAGNVTTDKIYGHGWLV